MLLASLCRLGAYADNLNQRPTTLEEIFESAEHNSSKLKPYLSAEEIAQEEILIVKNERLPEINTSLSLSFIGDGFTTKRNFSDYQKAAIPHLGTGLGVNISQPIYMGGTISNNIKLAKLKSSASRFASDLNRDNIRLQLTGFYLDIYKYHNLRKVMTCNLELAQKVLSEMKARHQQGVAIQNDITRYELLISNLELNLVKIDNILSILNTNLVVTAGMPQQTVIYPDSTILAKSLPLENENWWQQEAQANSPSIQLANSNIEISKRRESLVKADRLPKVDLQAGWTIDGPILVEIPPVNRNLSYWWVGLNVSYNLSSIYKSNKKITASKLATQQASENLDIEKENTQLQINSDFTKYLEAYEELKTQDKSVELASLNYKTIYTRYATDMALITDLLDAANSKLEAEQSQVNARINIIYYYYKLLFTSGKI